MNRKYYSYNDMPKPVYEHTPCTEPPPCIEHTPCVEPVIHNMKSEICKSEKKDNKLFGKFETDDVILGVVIIMLLANDCDDKILILAIAFIFLNGIVF